MELQTPSSRPTVRKRPIPVLVFFAIGLVVLLIGAKLGARYVLGLGDPPLSVADSQIEYMFAPSRTYRRFGNMVAYNQYSMRSDEFPGHKTVPGERRVLVLGDSVVNGGAQTDQSQLATSLLQAKLRNELNSTVYVGNVSAGSWGPPNELAYMRRFGLFDADVIVIEVSSHDADDMPTFEQTVGVDPDFPDLTPMFALQEAVTRYLPRYLRTAAVAPSPGESAGPSSNPTTPPARAVPAFRDMIELARASGARVVVVIHRTRSECDGGPFEPGHAELVAASKDLGIEPIDLGPAFTASLKAGAIPYRDAVHPNATGQQLIYQALLPSVKDAIRQGEDRIGDQGSKPEDRKDR